MSKLVIISAVLLTLLVSACGVDTATPDCKERGGVLVNGGKYGDDLCVKDGLIVAVYQ